MKALTCISALHWPFGGENFLSLFALTGAKNTNLKKQLKK